MLLVISGHVGKRESTPCFLSVPGSDTRLPCASYLMSPGLTGEEAEDGPCSREVVGPLHLLVAA